MNEERKENRGDQKEEWQRNMGRSVRKEAKSWG
jgi:hypothetical protein